AIFIFAVGMALATFTNRMGGGENANATATALAGITTFTATPVSFNATITTTATTQGAPANATATPGQSTEQPTTTPTSQPATQPTPIPTATVAPPTATATAGCDRALLAQFAPAYRPELGCPTSDAGIVWSAWEWFERGAMLWRDDNDRAYAFFNDGGWQPVDEKWEGQDVPSRGDAPPGLQAPQRGFGYAWGRSDALFQRLGWATDQERGFCAVIQSFERGFILQDSDIESCKDNLFNQARTGEWRALFIVAIENSGWANLAGTALPTPIPTATNDASTTVVPSPTPPVEATAVASATATPTPAPTATTTAQRERPAGNGIFEARNAGHTLDGNFDDWAGNWYAVTAVSGSDANYEGANDLSGDFQVSWSLEGLYLALRVNDDRYRAGPNGTDMWQGDAIELHFDRLLSEDYADSLTNDDDYQIGLSWGPDRNEVRLYRWLPQAQEGTFSISGVVQPAGEGYQAEVLVPWTLLDVTSGQLQSDQRFGFNVSISDNDGDVPAQETLLSASPNRTTYNNPTEWGTLILR
ncbi:MAG: hypothetical protein KDE53_11525, partial [Caldilineaceae bacterium]|nr:hypothetical protein [Caldilineaceae bacterium]